MDIKPSLSDIERACESRHYLTIEEATDLVAAVRAVLDLAELSKSKGEAIRGLGELRGASNAYVGMAQRIRAAVAAHLDIEAVKHG